MSSLSERARLGGYATAARHDPKQYTAAMLKAGRERFMKQVDPTGDLQRTNPKEAARRAEAARREFYVRMAYKSAEAKRQKAKRQARDAALGIPPEDEEAE